jgi:lysophospholipase L1-like esterase
MSHEPVDLLIVMLGTNDTKERFAASAGCIALGLKRLLDKAYSITDCWRDGVPNVLVVTPQNIGREYIHTEVGETMGRGCAEKSEGLAKEYEVVAKNRGCDYMDANEVISALPNTIDYMHLTEEAHRELAVALAKRIKEKWSEEA